MIKVLKQGNRFTCTCKKCNAELEYQLEDVKIMNICMNKYKDYIICPCCRNEIELMSYDQY